MSGVRRTLALAGAALVLLAPGCSGDDDADGSGATTTTTSSTDARTTTTSTVDGAGPEVVFASADEAPDGRPFIEIYEPAPVDVVAVDFTLAGTAVANEATVNWELADTNDKVVLAGHVTASCGTGCRGTFEEKISLRGVTPANYTLRVFEQSARDGERLHELTFPLTVHATRDEDPGPPPGDG